MRVFIVAGMCFAVSLCSVMMAAVQADERAPNGDEILALLGADLPKVFATLGGPSSAFVAGRDDQPEAEDGIFFDYLNFHLKLSKDRTSVAWISFYPTWFNREGNEWKGTIRGIKYGDNREKVQTALGRPYFSDGFGKDKNGNDIKSGSDTFTLTDLNGRLIIHYNNGGNADRAEALVESGLATPTAVVPATPPTKPTLSPVATPTPTPKATDSTVLYSDDFATLDPAWGEADANMSVGGNKLVLAPNVNDSKSAFYQGTLFGDADISVKVSLAKGSIHDFAGINFWGIDWDNYYGAAISGNGVVTVVRKLKGKWLFPVEKKAQDAAIKGLGKVNELRVVTRGKLVTFYVNSKQVASFKGFPPDGDSSIGLHAESGEREANTWQFSDLVVRKPQ